MMRRIVFVVVVVAVLVGSGVYWFWWSRAEAPSIEPSSVKPDVAAAQPETAETAPASATSPTGASDSEEKPVSAEPSLAAVRATGIVTDRASTKPVAGARVTLVEARRQGAAEMLGMGDSEGSGEPLTETETDATGSYSLEIPADAPEVALVCMASGYAKAEEPINPAGQAELKVDFFLDPGAVVTGVVTDSGGQAIEGVPVKVFSYSGSIQEQMAALESGKGRSYSAVTGPDGAYRCEGIAPGRYRATARGGAKGYVATVQTPTLINAEGGKTYDGINFVLELGAVVTGRVLNEKNQPVADAAVMVVPAQFMKAAMETMQNQQFDSFMKEPVKTDAEGVFRLDGLRFDTDYRLRATAEGYADATGEPFTTARNPGTTEQDVILSKGSTVSGVVRDSSGQPAPDQQVMLMPSLDQMMSGAMSEPKDTTSGKGGIFTIEGVAAGRYTATAGEFNPAAIFMGGAKESNVQIEVDGVNPVQGVELVVGGEAQVKAKGTIKGIVIEANGKPVTDAEVTARPEKGLGGSRDAKTEADGSFVIADLEGRRYDVEVVAEEGRAKQKGVEVGQRLTLKLSPPAAILGRVVESSGQPVASCSVSLQRADAGGKPMEMMFRGMAGADDSAQTDAQGAFAFENVEPGTYTVSAASNAKGAAKVKGINVAAGQRVDNVTVQLKAGVRVGGLVRDSSGRAVPGAMVKLTENDSDPAGMLSRFVPGLSGTSLAATSGDDGHYEILQVPEGDYLITATCSGYPGSAPKEVNVGSSDISDEDIRLPKGARVRGVFTKNGVPQANTMLQFVSEAGVFTVMTDAQGQYDQSNITPGAYMVTSINPSQLQEGMTSAMTQMPQVVDLADGEETPINEPLRGDVTLNGSISGENLGNIVAVSVRKPGGPAPEDINLSDFGMLRDAAQHTVGQAILNGDGSFSIEGLEPGEYIVEVLSMDIDLENPDVNALMNMDRTPQIRQNITVTGNEPINLNLTIP